MCWSTGDEGQEDRAARLVIQQTVVESGEFAYYEEDPSQTTLSLSDPLGWLASQIIGFLFARGSRRLTGLFSPSPTEGRF